MEPFATAADYAARWGEPVDVKRCDVFLLDATASLMSHLRKSGIAIDREDAEQSALLTMVCCNMAMRALTAPLDGLPISSVQQGAGPYSGTVSFDTSKDMYLTRQEKQWLGIGRQRIGSIHPAIRRQGGGGEDAL